MDGVGKYLVMFVIACMFTCCAGALGIGSCGHTILNAAKDFGRWADRSASTPDPVGRIWDHGSPDAGATAGAPDQRARHRHHRRRNSSGDGQESEE
jgi:hypothetical protein